MLTAMLPGQEMIQGCNWTEVKRKNIDFSRMADITKQNKQINKQKAGKLSGTVFSSLFVVSNE